MSTHAVYVMSAYLVALVILGGLLISSLTARQRVRRELAARGLERPREQRAKASQ
ncbi:MAG: heme exporter protein CcmD [Reyranella sp.]|nr:heme exporter protein CcmD [Reyranella sp.]